MHVTLKHSRKTPTDLHTSYSPPSPKACQPSRKKSQTYTLRQPTRTRTEACAFPPTQNNQMPLPPLPPVQPSPPPVKSLTKFYIAVATVRAQDQMVFPTCCGRSAPSWQIYCLTLSLQHGQRAALLAAGDMPS